MKKKLLLTLITSLIFSANVKADFAFSEAADFTGEAFFEPINSSSQSGTNNASSGEKSSRGTTPPIKQFRLMLEEKAKAKEARDNMLAPTAEDLYQGEIETSDYASKEVVDNFEDETTLAPDGFEADEEATQKPEKKKAKKEKKKKAEIEDSENIILDCENIDYDTQNYLIKANGNVSVEFVKQGIVVKADVITFDRVNNTIKAEGDVRILKGAQTITGDYIFVDMNEENALIENPITETSNIVIKSDKGYVYTDKIVQEDGSIVVDKSFPINFDSGKKGPKLRRMLMPKNQTLTEDIEKGIVKFEAKDIKITQKGDLEIIAIKKGKLFKGDKTIFKFPAIKVYTNKNHDYAETNHFEVGSYRGLGAFLGAGWVFELPKGSVLKAMPILNYKSGLGVGGYARFSSGTNHTMAAYGTAVQKMIVYGNQQLDDNLYLQYGMNSFMNEWFMGRRRPQYGASLVYDKSYASQSFLLKDRPSSFRHRIEGGYFQDLDFDRHFERLGGSEMGTTRFRYMAQASQNLFNYKDEEKLKAFSLNLVSQLSASVYGTGDTQILGRFAPTVSMQYKRWKQDMGYYFSAYEDNTPMPVFDAYRYGKQNLFLREYLRVNKYLTVSWFGSICITNDAPNNRDLQENAFYISVGPDDIKFHIGYDFIRETMYCLVEIGMDAKGTTVEYDTLEIKQDKKAKRSESPKKATTFEGAEKPKVLQRAVVEDIRVIEDVL